MAQQWLDHGDADMAAARTLLAAKGDNKPFTATFHAQQAAEKWMKAFMVWAGATVPYKHDLDEVQERLPDAASATRGLRDLGRLSVYAVEERYPTAAGSPMDLNASLGWDEVQEAITIAATVRESVTRDLTDAGFSLTE